MKQLNGNRSFSLLSYIRGGEGGGGGPEYLDVESDQSHYRGIDQERETQFGRL